MSQLTTPTIAAHEQILAVTEGFWHSRVLAVATELEIAELLAEGPLHVDVLAKKNEDAFSRSVSATSGAGDFGRVFTSFSAGLHEYPGQRLSS